MANKQEVWSHGCKFVLRGGKWDGVTVRLFPNNSSECMSGRAATYDDLDFGGVLYEHPTFADQSTNKPYMTVK